jgi:hypothetical protein
METTAIPNYRRTAMNKERYSLVRLSDARELFIPSMPKFLPFHSHPITESTPQDFKL